MQKGTIVVIERRRNKTTATANDDTMDDGSKKGASAKRTTKYTQKVDTAYKGTSSKKATDMVADQIKTAKPHTAQVHIAGSQRPEAHMAFFKMHEC